MIAAPPSEAGGRQDRLTWVLPADAVSPVGGPGFSTRACGIRTAVRTADVPGPCGPVPPGPASMAGQPARTTTRHVPAGAASHRQPDAATRARQAAARPEAAPPEAARPEAASGQRRLARRRGFMRTPAGV